jgi:DNA adenine methylase
VRHDPPPPKRPLLRYHGGKWKLAPWLISFMPPHRIYVEPFAGAGSVLLRKPRSHGEVLNDMDGEVVNVFRVLRDPAKAGELRRRLELTPFAREEFKDAYTPASDDIDAAVKMIVRAFMGYGSASMTRMHVTGFRSNSNRSGTIPAADWANWPAEVPAFVRRLRGVVIENRDFEQVIRQHDSPGTLFYVDPPYITSTRSSLSLKNGNRGHYYRHDMIDEDHRRMAAALHQVEGMVVLSGYPCEIYDAQLFPDWTRHETKHMADGARPRVEVVWLNEACRQAIEEARSQGLLLA